MYAVWLLLYTGVFDYVINVFIIRVYVRDIDNTTFTIPETEIRINNG